MEVSVELHALAAMASGKTLRFSLYRRAARPQKYPGHYGEEKKALRSYIPTRDFISY
jgi:hypothetical protein